MWRSVQCCSLITCSVLGTSTLTPRTQSVTPHCSMIGCTRWFQTKNGWFTTLKWFALSLATRSSRIKIRSYSSQWTRMVSTAFSYFGSMQMREIISWTWQIIKVCKPVSTINPLNRMQRKTRSNSGFMFCPCNLLALTWFGSFRLSAVISLQRQN